MFAATDTIWVNPLRKVEKTHGIKRRPQAANARRFPGLLLRRATGALGEFAG
jgi:hypothetical protein